MRNLNSKDAKKYLESGELSKPFLDDDFVRNKVIVDYENRLKSKGNANILESLYLWIDKNLKNADNDFKIKHKFMRTAEEIWNSGISTGCTDYALVFSTFARQIGIPTSLLHTAEKSFVDKILNNKEFDIRRGHSFCECFLDGEWILVDPTAKKIIGHYNANEIKLSYSLGGEGVSTYLPYYRGLDLGKKMNSKEHGKFEEECILKEYGNIPLKYWKESNIF